MAGAAESAGKREAAACTWPAQGGSPESSLQPAAWHAAWHAASLLQSKRPGMAVRCSLPTLLLALPGAHFSCSLPQLTQRDAEQLQAVLLRDRLPEGLDLGHTLPEQHLGLHEIMLQREELELVGMQPSCSTQSHCSRGAGAPPGGP